MLAAFIAQLVEHSFSKRKVHGSTPCGGRKYFFVLRIACPASASDFCFQCVYTHSTSTDSMSSSTQTQCKGTNGSIACQRSWDPQPCRITSVRAAHISVPSFSRPELLSSLAIEWYEYYRLQQGDKCVPTVYNHKQRSALDEHTLPVFVYYSVHTVGECGVTQVNHTLGACTCSHWPKWCFSGAVTTDATIACEPAKLR